MYTYTYMYLHIHTCTHTHDIHIHVHLFVHMYMRESMYICIHNHQGDLMLAAAGMHVKQPNSISIAAQRRVTLSPGVYH